MSGLEKPAVRRLHCTWERISSKYIRMLEDVQQLVDPSRNMSKYRQHLAEVSQEPPVSSIYYTQLSPNLLFYKLVVPIYPVIKKDLTFSHEGNPTYTDKLVNFEKLRLIAKSVRAVTKLSSAPYEISSMAERSGGIISDALLHMNTFEGSNVATMRKGGRISQPRKKLIYEQALMVRKVKSYLEGLHVVDVEGELDRLSYDIEPQQQGPRPRRAPSPTPSSLSSQSAGSSSTDHRRFAGSMFGVESPQAVQKMLALVQNSKMKGGLPSPMSSPSSGRGLQRNVARVTSRQQSAPSIQRTPSLKHEPVDLNKETSSVTSFYGSGMNSSNFLNITNSPSDRSSCKYPFISRSRQMGTIKEGFIGSLCKIVLLIIYSEYYNESNIKRQVLCGAISQV
uniref:Ras-GEF domain-containing protein n=1 Tax=Heterorhabditis bacteriophora TaxID=37862 RepID=A0A1I7WWR4_HETBA